MRARMQAVSRTATFGPVLGLPLYGWTSLGQPAHLAGLGVMIAAAACIWPLAVVSVLFFVPELLAPAGMVPRSWRIRYRQRHGRDGAASSYIGKRLRRVVYFADGHRCAGCGARRVRLQIDHILPWAAGGRTTLWNCMSLCEPCNGIKLNYSKDRDKYEHYAGSRYWIPQARQILARERRHRLNPVRWARAAWALGA
jgi:hypothetical protein